MGAYFEFADGTSKTINNEGTEKTIKDMRAFLSGKEKHKIEDLTRADWIAILHALDDREVYNNLKNSGFLRKIYVELVKNSKSNAEEIKEYEKRVHDEIKEISSLEDDEIECRHREYNISLDMHFDDENYDEDKNIALKANGKSVETIAMNGKMKSDIRKALDKLAQSNVKHGQEFKRLIEMMYFEDRLSTEIAKELGVAPSTITKWHEKAIEYLRQELM